MPVRDCKDRNKSLIRDGNNCWTARVSRMPMRSLSVYTNQGGSDVPIAEAVTCQCERGVVEHQGN